MVQTERLASSAEVDYVCKHACSHFRVSWNDTARKRFRVSDLSHRLVLDDGMEQDTYEISPVDHWKTGSTSLPSLSNGLIKWKVASKDTIEIHREASAKYLPTHTRRPKPKGKSIVSSFNCPSAMKNLSGLKTSGFGYFTSSFDMAL